MDSGEKRALSCFPPLFSGQGRFGEIIFFPSIKFQNDFVSFSTKDKICLIAWCRNMVGFCISLNLRMCRLFFHQTYFSFSYGNRHMGALNKELHLLPRRIGSKHGWQIALSPSTSLCCPCCSLFCGLARVGCWTQHSI